MSKLSEVKIKDAIIETIDAVRALTKDLPSDDGTTAKAVGQSLKLDKSTASRRLRSAEDGGFITNLETRKGRPGRYRTTDELIEVEQMLPTSEALKVWFPAGPLQPLQPATKRENGVAVQGDSGCNSGCTPLATTENGEKLGKTEVRLHGCTVSGGVDGEKTYEPDSEDLEFEPKGSQMPQDQLEVVDGENARQEPETLHPDAECLEDDPQERAAIQNEPDLLEIPPIFDRRPGSMAPEST